MNGVPLAVIEAGSASHAEQTLLEQALIRVGPEAFDAFLARLDAPPAPNERLRRTMRTPPPWERE